MLCAAAACVAEHYSMYDRSRTFLAARIQRTCLKTSAATSLTHDPAAMRLALRAHKKPTTPNSDISHGCRWGMSPRGIRLGDVWQ